MQRLQDLVDICKRVKGDICDQDTGWYYQFVAAIEKADKALRDIAAKEKSKGVTMIETVEFRGKAYKVMNGTYYTDTTPDRIVELFEQIRMKRTRVLLDYGDKRTGQSWGEVNDIKGTVSRSTGPVKCPLLVHNSRSRGGTGIITDCIVKVSTQPGGVVLWQHPQYKTAF